MDTPRRLFFALWPEQSVREAILACRESIRSHAPVRWVPAGNLHVTLRFLGPVDAARLRHILSFERPELPAFHLEFPALRYWPRRKLLWLETRQDPPAMSDLIDRLPFSAAGCGDAGRHSAKSRVPHVTLARQASADLVLPERIDAISWPVNEYALVESLLTPAGARYCVLKTWPLRSMPPAGTVK
jgi:2'-5' RNA ligase